MNSFIKNNKRFFSLVLGILLNGSLYAITMNGELLENIIKPGEVVSATFPENSGIVIKIERDNFYINDADIDGAEGLQGTFEDVVQKSNCPMSSGGQLSMSFGTMERSWARFVSGKSIDFKANVLLSMSRCILDSPHVSLAGNKMEFGNCFLINTKTLNITLNGTEWDCIVRVEFHNQSKNPTLLDANIDLKNDEAKSNLVIANAKEVSLQFVFHKKPTESSQPVTTSNITRNEKGILAKSFQAVVNFLRSI